jgi:DNA-binding NarL/FixJ family response regulator
VPENANNAQPPRVLIVDQHEVSRAACRALLRTEGLTVVADVATGDEAMRAATALRPNVVIIDVAPGHGHVLDTARRLRALPGTPAIVLTSSADPSRLDIELADFPFVAKADICAELIRLHMTT